MQPNLELFEKQLRLKKMDAAKDELELSKLKLMQKIDKLESEIEIQNDAIEKLRVEIISLQGA